MSFKESGNGSFFIDSNMQTQRNEADERILEDLADLLLGLGCTPVEVKSASRRGVVHVVLVIHRSGGVDVDACADVYRAVYPRLEMMHPGSEIQLEVSSPGIDRNLKSTGEFEIFTGFNVKILLEQESDWRKGVIVRTSGDSVDIEVGEATETYKFSSIRKAKLDNP